MKSFVVGDKFMSLLTGKVFEVKSITDWAVVLESGDNLSQVLTDRENLKLFYQRIVYPNQPDLTK